MKKLLIPMTIAAGLAASSNTHAQTTSQVYGDTLTRQTQTFFLAAEADWTTYNSEAVGSNASGMTSAFTVGGYSGENRVMGVFLTSTDQDLDFSLNQSQVRNRWYDLRMQARLGYIYPSVGVSVSETKMVNDTAVITDVYARGLNAGLGFKVPVKTFMIINGEALVVSAQSARDRDGKEVALGLRQEADLNASFDVTKNMVDFMVGYRLRRFELEVEDEKFQETQSAPYAGLRLGTYF